MTVPATAAAAASATRTGRIERVQACMAEAGVDALLLSVGPDLPYLVGYEAMPLERLTMLVLPRSGAARLVVPRLEAMRVDAAVPAEVVAWDETDDPVALVASMVAPDAVLAIGDRTWARFVVDLQGALPSASWRRGSEVIGPVRIVKDDTEIAALETAAHAVDDIAVAMRGVAFAGRSEIDVHRELAERIAAAGHQRLNFAIVAAGPNAASPHHEPGSTVIRDGDLVLCDFGGTMHGYCSDITRMYSVGEPTAEVAESYAVLRAAQETGVRAAVVGATCESVDRATRSVIEAAGLGAHFVHRTGHGIGAEEHEDPYIVAGDLRPLVPGHAFSIEPGIYVSGRYGMRLEDIVVATADGPRRLNAAPRDLAIVA